MEQIFAIKKGKVGMEQIFAIKKGKSQKRFQRHNLFLENFPKANFNKKN